MNNTIKLSIAASLLLTITVTAAELESITVTTTNKTVHSIEDTTSTVIVITAEELEESGYLTVSQAINTIAGISVTNSGGLGQQTSFFVRGADSGKVLVLLDGMRLNDPSTTNGTALLESLTTENIQQIEIIKGGMSSIWGSNASAGVINIITKEAHDGIHGSVGVNYGSYQTRGTNAEISYKEEKLTARLFTSYLKTNGFSALSPESSEKDGYENKTYNIKLGYAFDMNNQLNLSYNRINTQTEYDTYVPNDSNSTSDTDQTNMALDYNFKADNYSAVFHASKGEYDREYSYGTYNAVLKEYSLVNAYSYTSGKVVLGMEYKDIDGFSSGEYTNKAIFLSNIYNINENMLLETNLRYDNYDEFKNKITYKVGLKHHHTLLEGLTTAANYYTAYDAPSSFQLANQLAPETLLKPSYTKGYEISANYNELISIAYFDNKVEDSIDWISLFDAEWNYLGGGYTNIDGNSHFRGLEAESTYRFESMNLNLTANYTHLFEATKEDGSDLIRRPNDTLNLSANYYTDSNSYGVTAQYVGERKDLKYNPDYTSSEVSTGKYTLWNLNYARELTEEIKLTINVKNIFDKEYQSVYSYATEGRSAYAKIQYRF